MTSRRIKSALVVLVLAVSGWAYAQLPERPRGGDDPVGVQREDRGRGDRQRAVVDAYQVT